MLPSNIVFTSDRGKLELLGASTKDPVQIEQLSPLLPFLIVENFAFSISTIPPFFEEADYVISLLISPLFFSYSVKQEFCKKRNPYYFNLLLPTSSLIPAWAGGMLHERRPPDSMVSQFLALYAVHFSKQHCHTMREGIWSKEVERSFMVSHKSRTEDRKGFRNRWWKETQGKNSVRYSIQDWLGSGTALNWKKPVIFKTHNLLGRTFS